MKILLKLAANDTEIARLMALTTEQNQAIDGYIETAREHATALELKDTEIALLNETISTNKPDTAKFETRLRESKLQTTIAENALANSERLMAALNKASTALEATNRELQRQLGVADNNARAVTATAVNAKDEYITALPKSIENMKFVLDIVLTASEDDVDAAKMVIHRPVLSDGDPLMQSNKAVVAALCLLHIIKHT